MAEWKKVKLGEVGNTYTGLSGKTKEDFGHGKAKYIPYINIFNNTFVDISALEDIEVDEKQNCVQKGDVFFTTSSETPEEVGMSSVLLQDVENTYLNSFCFGYRPEKIFDSVFLAFMLRSDLVRKQFKILAQGISRFNISKTKVMEDILIFVPPIEEQQKIAEILSTQDKVIELKQKLIDEKKRQKKYLMQNLLTGKIRLDGFSGKWEKVKLGEVCEMFSGGTPKSDEKAYYNGNIPFIRSAEISSNHTELFISESGYKNSSAKMVNINDLLYALYGANSGECAISKQYGAINQAILCIRCDNILTYYLYSCLTYMKENIIVKYLQGGQGNLSATIIKGIQLKVPDINEQTAIAEILSAQDKEIELLEKQLEQEKLKKKALMQLLLTGKIRVA